ncbi:site-specific integrase [Hymenobacter fastidiosus]|uniref:Site-specific integrase n=1 Tax=Hymenobacter fastidiosus TaxID=486264 RepID=A0ABP7RQT2_9BACT
MAATKLRLRNDRTSFGLTTVYVQYVYKSQNHYYSTGKKISPDEWNAGHQKVAGTSDEVKKLNAALSNHLSTVNRIIADADHHGIPATPGYVREQLKAVAAAKAAPHQATAILEEKPAYNLLTLFAEYIEQTKAAKAVGTVKHYRSTLNHLRSYATTRKTELPFDRVDVRLYHDLVDYFITECQLSNGTINNQLKRVKAVMGHAVELGLTENRSYERFKLLDYTENDIVYLTQEEFQIIVTSDLSMNERLDRVRDLFVLGCTTALRFSDLNKVSVDQVRDGVLTVRQQKTREWVYIDLNQYSRNILQKYPNGLPRISEQKYNKYLKELGQVCGIDSSIQVVRIQGTKRIEEIVPKYELMTSHIARKTFTTLSLAADMPVPVIKQYTGHSSDKTFQRYAKVTDKLKRDHMARVWDTPRSSNESK